MGSYQRIPVYPPWAIFQWWYQFDAHAPHVVDRAGGIAGASGLWDAMRRLPAPFTSSLARLDDGI